MVLIRFFGYLFGLGAVFGLIAALIVFVYLSKLTDGLADTSTLKNYQPPVMTRVHASDGRLLAEYARERRLFLPIEAIPAQVKNAFLSAEDKGFYDHFGIDFQGIARAIMVNIRNRGSSRDYLLTLR